MYYNCCKKFEQLFIKNEIKQRFESSDMEID